ncbi:head-tail connector protein [Liquorilactobacillus satsumensis]|uniref:head-tail connector protein n=1 Tax=Liquorilactobacillus satsumensis TaxID=259059 RepID=UPI0006D09222|nr:head-tail connector protein [Liquorilactobacillus satsumensis]
MAVDTNTMVAELNLDDDEDNTALVASLILDSKSLILDSLGLKDDSTLSGNVLYDRCLKTVVTQFYYDRTLSTGLSAGTMLMLIHLKAQVLPDATN